MTSVEIFSEIQKMPIADLERISNQVQTLLRQKSKTEITGDVERREMEFARKMKAQGLIAHLPARNETDADDDFEPLEIEGEPLSEQIMRERR